ncbi:hypothetical protein [Phaeobacter inhibens]|uniref:Magnesium transporter MgtE intracellular domain-containing protein n=1 Tax=Phaeobacter inhibens TaxID=221822 RepID=A0A2I7KHG6_9RHOB|nr:hypothetical protein [Phaeobacter inhibens]AUR02016.1 hypothetical protein PhaeoP88_04704 [Phaeobacter inhibens]
MKHFLWPALLLILSAGRVSADDISSLLETLTPYELQALAEAAISEANEDRLLEIMTEMKRRKLWIFAESPGIDA